MKSQFAISRWGGRRTNPYAFPDSHDRFLIIDHNAVYHIGASLKDLGKKWFAFSRMEIDAIQMIAKLGVGGNDE